MIFRARAVRRERRGLKERDREARDGWESDCCLPLRMYLIRHINRRVCSEINSLHVSNRSCDLLHALKPLPHKRRPLHEPSERTVKS